MTDDHLPSPAPIPADDLSRSLTVGRPDQDLSLPHIGLVGDTYTILVSGQDTAGKPPPLDDEKQAAFIAKAAALAPHFRTELIPPPGQGVS